MYKQHPIELFIGDIFMFQKLTLAFISFFILSLSAGTPLADTHKPKPDANTAFEVQHDIREAERRAIVASNLRLSEDESTKFWPIYDAYRNKVKDQEKAGFGLLQRIAKTFGNVPQDEAVAMVTQALDIESTVQNIRNEHLLELQNIIEGTKLFRYFQIDARLNAIFKFQLTKKIPLLPVQENQ